MLRELAINSLDMVSVKQTVPAFSYSYVCSSVLRGRVFDSSPIATGFHFCKAALELQRIHVPAHGVGRNILADL